jgi:SAM-dependent methyltransferase
MDTARTLRSRLARLRSGDAGPRNGDARLIPWESALAASTSPRDASCNICGWHGAEFGGVYHSESAICPSCNSIARDRYLYWCWTHRTGYDRDARVLETSPRLDARYRSWMGERVRYLASDYDESAHKATIKLDIQNIDLPDASLDVILTPHVLEHVPDTEKSLAEIVRVLAPGGSVFIEIPLQQGGTSPPPGVEYHGDNTLVYWRFGWDLADKMEAAGLRTATLVTADLDRRVRAGDIDSHYGGDDCDEVDVLSHAEPDTWTVVADSSEARRYGFLPDFMFVCWHGVKRA